MTLNSFYSCICLLFILSYPTVWGSGDIVPYLYCNTETLTWKEAWEECIKTRGTPVPYDLGIGLTIKDIHLHSEADFWTSDYALLSPTSHRRQKRLCGFSYLPNNILHLKIMYGDCNAQRYYLCKNDTTNSLGVHESERFQVKCQDTISTDDLIHLAEYITPGYYWMVGIKNVTIEIINHRKLPSTSKFLCGAYSADKGQYFANCNSKKSSLCYFRKYPSQTETKFDKRCFVNDISQMDCGFVFLKTTKIEKGKNVEIGYYPTRKSQNSNYERIWVRTNKNQTVTLNITKDGVYMENAMKNNIYVLTIFSFNSDLDGNYAVRCNKSLVSVGVEVILPVAPESLSFLGLRDIDNCTSCIVGLDGEEFSVTCQVNGGTEPTSVSMLIGNKSLPNVVHHGDGRYVAFSRLLAKYHGCLITCFVKNDALKSPMSVKALVFVENEIKPLTFDPPDTSYEIKEKSKLGPVTCDSECKPPCTFTWKNLHKGTLVSNNSTLSLDVLTSSDAGTYQCIASRSGLSFRTKDLIVKVIFEIPKPSTKAQIAAGVSSVGVMVVLGVSVVLLWRKRQKMCERCSRKGQTNLRTDNDREVDYYNAPRGHLREDEGQSLYENSHEMTSNPPQLYETLQRNDDDNSAYAELSRTTEKSQSATNNPPNSENYENLTP